MQGLTPIRWHSVPMFVDSFNRFRYSYPFTFCQLKHLQSLSVVKSDTQRDEDPLYCTRRLCESGHEDPVMLNLIIRGFVIALDILPLSKFEGKRQAETLLFLCSYGLTPFVPCVCSRLPSRLSQRIEIGAPTSNSNFTKALQGIKNIHSTFAAQCPPRSLDAWIPPVSQSGILRIDFVTPYLSSDDNLPSAELDTSHDPDGVLQTIIARSDNKFYTEDNKVDYLKMNKKDNVHLYVSISRSRVYLLLNVKPLPALNP